jgi:hypothetical protein
LPAPQVKKGKWSKEKERNLEDGEKSGLMQISQGKENIQPVSMR